MCSCKFVAYIVGYNMHADAGFYSVFTITK